MILFIINIREKYMVFLNINIYRLLFLDLNYIIFYIIYIFFYFILIFFFWNIILWLSKYKK